MNRNWFATLNDGPDAHRHVSRIDLIRPCAGEPDRFLAYLSNDEVYSISKTERDRIIGRMPAPDYSAPQKLRPMVELSKANGLVLLYGGGWAGCEIGRWSDIPDWGPAIETFPGNFISFRCFTGWLPVPKAAANA